MTTAALFAGGRFVVDPYREQTAMACASNPTNAAALLLSNPAGTGTYTRTGSTLTLRFVDGATAVLSVRSLA